jgi:hypothetical protein
MTKARDIADFKFENIVDTGTEGTKVASGTTAQRGSTQGQIRFNSTTGLAEYYTGNVFKSIDIAPMVTSVNNTNISGDSITAGFDLVITGTNFATGATVKFIGNDGTIYSSPTVTINSGEQVTARIPTNIDASKEPFDVQVTSAGGLSSLKEDAFNIDAVPAWTTASGTIGGGFNGDTISLQVTATDPDGSISSYGVQSGALPSGVSLNTSTGAITGTLPTVGSVTTSTFTIRATSNSGQTTDRQFNIVNGGSGSTSINTSGGNFTISQAQPVKVYVIGGGGGGGGEGGNDTLASNEEYGGGGGGGMAYKLFPNLAAGTYSFTVGSGGSGGSRDASPTAGGTSSITLGGVTLQATGGGAGGTDNISGGGYTVYSASGRGSFGGAGGVGSGGDINGTGGQGGAGIDDYTTNRTYTTASAYTSGEDTSAGKNGINGGAGGGGAGTEQMFNPTGSSDFTVGGLNHGGNGDASYYTGGGGGGGSDAGGSGSTAGAGGTGYASGGQGSTDGGSNTSTNGGGSVGGARGISSGTTRGNAGGGGGSHGGGGGGGADSSNANGNVGSGAGGGGAVVIIT